MTKFLLTIILALVIFMSYEFNSFTKHYTALEYVSMYTLKTCKIGERI